MYQSLPALWWTLSSPFYYRQCEGCWRSLPASSTTMHWRWSVAPSGAPVLIRQVPRWSRWWSHISSWLWCALDWSGFMLMFSFRAISGRWCWALLYVLIKLLWKQVIQERTGCSGCFGMGYKCNTKVSVRVDGYALAWFWTSYILRAWGLI